MTEFLPDLPARDVDRRLRAALSDLQRAERNAVLWFAELLRRKLYRDLGYGSMHQYAEVALGFGTAKTAQFIRLSESLRELPRLRESLARGEVGWTKARTVAAVATPETETVWLRAAKVESRRKLEDRVRRARGRTRGTAKLSSRAKGQEALTLAPAPAATDAANTRVPRPGAGASAQVSAPEELAAVTVQLKFTPEQYARYEALLELLRRQGARDARVELLLEALESLAAERVPTADAQVRIQPPSYQVRVQLCPSCDGGWVVTGRGPRAVHPKELMAILCDAKV